VAQPRADARLHELSFIAFDAETTGLAAASDRIVELSAERFTLQGDGEAHDAFDQLVDPGRPIPPEAARVNRLRDEDVRGKPDAGHVLAQFKDWAGGSVLLAHNAEFDVGFLTYEAARHGVQLPFCPVLDTVEISRRVRPDLPNHKLETLSRALGCHAQTYHRALADARTLARCFRLLLERHYAAAGGSQDATLGDLIRATAPALAFGSPGRLRMWLPEDLQPLDDALQRGTSVTVVYRPPEKGEQIIELWPRGYVRRPGETLLIAVRASGGAELSLRLDWITRSHRAQQSLF
jgi:DNA polymerase III epsilon subunit family exonuclease